MNQSTGRRTLLLTGAAGRLGTAIIELAGQQLDIIALIHENGLHAGQEGTRRFNTVTAEFSSSPVRSLKCDLTSQEQITFSIESLTSLGYKINYVINAAGDVRFLGQTTDAMMLVDEARRQFEVNLFAPALICSALFHFQWKNIPVVEQEVSILHISSLSGVQVFSGSGQGFYAASKAAANMLTMHMAFEYGRYAIRANALAPNNFPGIVDTNVVASNALRILDSNASGQIFKIGEDAYKGASSTLKSSQNGAEP